MTLIGLPYISVTSGDVFLTTTATINYLILGDNVTNITTSAVVNTCTAPGLCPAERIGHAIIAPAICIFGMLLNVLNLVILSQPRFKESSYTYLTNLAIADFLSLFFFAVNGIGRGHYPNDPGWRAFEVYAYFPFGASTTTASVWLTVTVTVERFVFIYWPAESKSWCRQEIARRVSVIVWLVCIIINVPRFFVTKVGDKGQLAYTEFSKSIFYGYLSWCYLFIVSLGAGACLIIFNILLIVGIRRASARRRAMSHRGSGDVVEGSKHDSGKPLVAHNNGEGDGDHSHPNGAGMKGSGEAAATSVRDRRREKDESTLTRTLIVIVCVFIVGEMPSAFTSRGMVVALLGDTSVVQSAGYRVAVLVSTLLVVSQHSVNFVVYCVFNRRFCEALREKLPDRCRRAAGITSPGRAKNGKSSAVESV